MDYKHSCVIDAQKLYKTFVLVMLVPTDDGSGVLDLGELGSASMTKLGQSDPALERAIGYIPGGLGKGATVYAGATDDGRVLYYALSASGAEAAIVLEDPAQEAVATYVGPRVYRDGAYHIVDDNDGGDITYTFTASGNVSAEIQHYTIQDGEQLVDTTPPTMRPYTGAAGLVTPRWDAAASAWVEGATEEEVAAWEAEYPDPNAKTLEELRADKETEISDACNTAIVAGMDVETSQGTEHFALQETDQINLTTALSAVETGAAGYPYHADGQLCRMFTREEIEAIAKASIQHKLYHTTLCNHLLTWARRAETAEELDGITYSADNLPEDLATNMAQVLAVATAMSA